MSPLFWIACSDTSRALALYRACTRRGYRCLLFSTGSSALAELDTGDVPSGLIVDQRLPGVLGASVIGLVRDLGCHAPAILLGEIHFPSDEGTITLAPSCPPQKVMEVMSQMTARLSEPKRSARVVRAVPEA